NGVRLALDPAGQAFRDRGLADTRFADQHHRVRAPAMAENLEHLLNLTVAAKDRRQLVEAGEQVQAGRDLLEIRWQVEALPDALEAQFPIADVGVEVRDNGPRVGARLAEERRQESSRLLEQRHQQIGGIQARAALAGRTMKR